MTAFSAYDQWKLATPPEYEWPDPAFYCDDCGAFDWSECLCDSEPDPEELMEMWDEADENRLVAAKLTEERDG